MATVLIHQRDNAASNYQELLYLRKDLVESLLGMKGIELVSKVYGERRLARIEHFDSSDGFAVKFKDFEFIAPVPIR